MRWEWLAFLAIGIACGTISHFVLLAIRGGAP